MQHLSLYYIYNPYFWYTNVAFTTFAKYFTFLGHICKQQICAKPFFGPMNKPHTDQWNQQLCQGTYLIIVSLKFLIFFFKKRYFSLTLPLQFFNCFLVFSMAITKKIIIPRWKMTWKIKLRHFCDKNRRPNLRYLDKTVTWWY